MSFVLRMEAVVRKRILVLSLIGAALLAVNASTAQAAPFSITLSDGTVAGTVTINDNTVGDLLLSSADRMLFNGTVGAFTVRIGTNYYESTGPSGAPVQMTVGTIQVSSASAGQLTASISRPTVSSSLLGGAGNLAYGIASAGVTTNTGGSITFQHSLAGQTLFNNTGLFLPTTSGPVLLNGDYVPLLTTLTFDFTGNGTITGSTDLQLYGATPLAASEPTTLFLFGVGLLGLVGWRRHASAG